MTYSPDQLWLHLKILGGSVVILWGLELVDTILLRGRLNRYGIRPRRLVGLRGIVLAPLLHGNLGHLAANTLPFLVLGWFILLQGTVYFAIATGAAWLISGWGVWLTGGARSNHIGASGIIFGYLGFLLVWGYIAQSWEAILLATLATGLYGSSIWGVLPLHRGRSWQGHLFGLLGGGLAAYWLPSLQDKLPL